MGADMSKTVLDRLCREFGTVAGIRWTFKAFQVAD